MTTLPKRSHQARRHVLVQQELHRASSGCGQPEPPLLAQDRGGIVQARRPLPPGFPPSRTVYGRFRRWLGMGLSDALLRETAPTPPQGRPTTGAEAGHHRHPGGEVHRRPRAVRGRRGQGCGRAQAGGAGRRRGPLAGVRRRTGFRAGPKRAVEALDAGKARWATLREAVYDGAFAAERCRAWSNLYGMHHRVVARHPVARDFVISDHCSTSLGNAGERRRLARSRPARTAAAGPRCARRRDRVPGPAQRQLALLDPLLGGAAAVVELADALGRPRYSVAKTGRSLG
jgi:hypothetical protein